MNRATSDVWEVMRTARAVRRYRADAVSLDALHRCLEAATWAPSGGNQQPWRFVVVTDPEVRDVLGGAARATWAELTRFYGLRFPDPADESSRARVVRSMYHHMMNAATVPVLLLFCVQPQRGASDLQNGGSIFPAIQNFSLAARAQGIGTAVTLWHDQCEAELRTLVGIPDDWLVAAVVTAGWPRGSHGPVNRKPVAEVTALDRWDQPLA